MSNPNKKKVPLSMILIIGIAVVVIPLVTIIGNIMSRKDYNYSEIVNHFKNQEVSQFSMNLGSGDMVITLKDNQLIKYTAPNVNVMYSDIKDYVSKYDSDHPDAPMVYNLIKASEMSWIFNSLIITFLPMLIIALILWLMMRKITVIGGDAGRSFSFGRTKARKDPEKQKTKFDCVAGADEEKEELAEVVDFLKSPKKYSDLGARIPKGILLVGPPGTGKTLLARAVAGEADVPFYSMSGSDFVEMFVGVGASRVRDLFGQAKKTVPCVVFIDEIDAVGRRRGSALMGGGHDEREQTLNQLLVEMDGFDENNGIIVIAATNRADILDPALTRPGRFDRSIYVGYPDIKGREEILRIHAKGKPFDSDVRLKEVAKSTPGFTGADLENLLNESALLAARRNKKVISGKEIQEATVKVIVGPEKKSHVITENERKLTAYHESGHAIVTHFCSTQDPVHQISIIPSGHAGGYTLSFPEKDKMYETKTKMEEEIATCLGGRVAEKLIFDEISTGASNDIDRASKIARSMVTVYGMNDKVGPITYYSPNNEFMGTEYPYSDSLASQIDSEVKKIIDSGYRLAERILTENIENLHKTAETLLSKEKISGDEFREILSPQV